MRSKQLLLSLMLLVGFAGQQTVMAHKDPTAPARPVSDAQQQQIDFRSNCDAAVAQIDMEINNVRARLTTGGDVWWDGDNGRYVVPKTPPGVPEVSSIFAGAVWLGGRDPGGGLEVAAQQYGRGGGNFDYYPGPLTDEGTTSADTCSRWDRFFVVKGQEIRDFLATIREASETPGGLPLDPAQVPQGLLGWPATGNPFFFDVHGFELPTTNQGLAGYWDADLDGTYDPTNGDYPIIEIRGCSDAPQFPEEMTFWIYNDAGNVHRQSSTPTQIQMEIQVQAFAYETADDINNMTFQRYKLINRAQEDILDTYFAMWVDPDLGCFTDDYVGCDTTRDLAYVYNEDELDGAPGGCTCDGGVATYCDEVPILGVDYFRGPRKPLFNEDGDVIGEEELGMSSFIYINNAGIGEPDPGTTDPNTADEYYNYLQGIWRDGSPLYGAGDGYQEVGAPETRYVFSDAPNLTGGFSMVENDLPFGDRRTIQASGPFTLQPGAVNELIIGVVWVPDQTYPAPSLQRLQTADDLAQDLFDSCFDIFDGPDAPDMDIVELDREIVLLLGNGPTSNNFEEMYEEVGFGIPDGQDSIYRFEGYRIYQLSGPNVSLAEIDNPERVREIAQFDLRNGIQRIFNWTEVEEQDNPNEQPYLTPSLAIDSEDDGLRHSISITQDAFEGDRLINHRRYYFAAIAYAYNNYKQFDPTDADNPGQPTPYRVSSRNIGDPDTGEPNYVAIPRPILDQELMASFGDGIPVTRLSGQGNNGNFLDLTEASEEDIAEYIRTGALETGFNDEISYEEGAGPINVMIVNPLKVVDGEYEITFVDDDLSDDDLEGDVNWILRALDDPTQPVIMSERPISFKNEQVIGEFGFSVQLFDVPEPGEEPEAGNGAIGGSVTYADPEGDQWLSFASDNISPGTGATIIDNSVFDYVNTEMMGTRAQFDPEQFFSDLLPGVYPYKLFDWAPRANQIPFISPVWVNNTNGSVDRFISMSELNNVNVVLTSNKDLWSRCPVVETSNNFYSIGQFGFQGVPFKDSDDAKMFDTRDAPSVTKEADSDGLPRVDTDIDPDLERGMGWFPGYAYDVETGQRLEIFWGENSTYDGRTIGDEGFTAQSNGNDMIWNPSSLLTDFVPGLNVASPYHYVGGGQHFFYVTQRPYDAGEFLESRLEPRTTGSRKVNGLREITWAAFPLLSPGSELLSYDEGLIPNDATIKLRVNNKYDYAEGAADANGYPTYRFTVDGKMANDELSEAGVNRALEMINVVPNPYYAYSSYEDSQFETNVKITNLPAQATVTIYSLDGKFIRKYERDEVPAMLRGERTLLTRQISPALEWDLKNFRGIPVASGVYLIHVAAPGLGERTLKFFGVQRQFDPSGL